MNLRFLGVKEWLRRGWGDRSPAQHLWNSVLVGFGYLLSPLSWWNDLVFNLPIAYGFARLVTWGHRDWLGPAVLLGYWLSNVLGLVMMQWGVVDWVRSPNRRDWLWSLGSATVYSLAIAALVYGHWLKLPEGLLP
ncbi:MAG: hypothetical protein ACO331_07635 [Prochlorothrix sp.]